SSSPAHASRLTGGTGVAIARHRHGERRAALDLVPPLPFSLSTILYRSSPSSSPPGRAPRLCGGPSCPHPNPLAGRTGLPTPRASISATPHERRRRAVAAATCRDCGPAHLDLGGGVE
ncbi:unnamed protein product, partial [Urochloa humidicola]